jgi:putative transposase
MIEFKGSHFEREVILWGIRWYVAYPISYRQLEEMLEERGVEVDHSTLNRWVVKYVPLLDQQMRARKRPVGASWRLDETYVKVKGSWKYLYRAVDKAGATVDFLLTAKRDRKAALRFLRKAIGQHGVPKKIPIDKSGANTAAIESYNAEHEAEIEIRQNKFLTDVFDKSLSAPASAIGSFFQLTPGVFIPTREGEATRTATSSDLKAGGEATARCSRFWLDGAHGAIVRVHWDGRRLKLC